MGTGARGPTSSRGITSGKSLLPLAATAARCAQYAHIFDISYNPKLAVYAILGALQAKQRDLTGSRQ